MNEIIMAITFNLTDFMENWMVHSLGVYTNLLGNFAWGIMFGFIGAGIYVGSRSIPTTFAYLCIIGLVFSIILPGAIIGLFALVAAFIGTSILYNTFVSSRNVG